MTTAPLLRPTLTAALLALLAAGPGSGQETVGAPSAPEAADPPAPGPAPAAPHAPVHVAPTGPPVPPAPRRPGYLGVVLDDVTAEDVEQRGLPEERGALVKRVVDGSPADSAGVRPDDVVLRWAGDRVFSAAELSRLVRETPPGREVRVRVFRDGGRTTLTVVPGERETGHLLPGRLPPEARIRVRERLEDAQRQLERVDEHMGDIGERMRDAWEKTSDSLRVHAFHFGPSTDGARLGVGLQELTPQLADYFELGNRTGVLVASVRDDSPADDAGLRAGDVLLSVAGRDVGDISDGHVAVRKASGEIEVRVLRRGEERTLTARLPADEENGSGS